MMGKKITEVNPGLMIFIVLLLVLSSILVFFQPFLPALSTKRAAGLLNGKPTQKQRFFWGMRMDINKVQKDDLKLITGIGEAKAEKIIEWRNRKGRIENLDDLALIPGFGRHSVEYLKKFVK